MTKIDENTGLPELPEGYFWRVRQTHKESPYLRVEMILRIQDIHENWLGIQKLVTRDKVVEWTAVEKERATPGEIRRSADHVIWKNRQSKANWESVIGDYPPKKLES